MNYFGSIFAMVVCIAMSAYFSATETAFSSLNKTRLKVLADNGNKRAALALKLSEDYNKLITTILIGNNIVNIMVASIGTLLFVELYGDIGATVSTVVVTIVVLIFGEITPKSVAKDTPERFAMFSAPFIRLWIWVLTWWSTALPSTSMATARLPPVSSQVPRSASTTAGCPICSASALCWIPLPPGS